MQFFANLNTKAKIFLGFLVVIIINLIIVISAISALSSSQKAALLIDDTLAHAFQRINTLQSAVQTFNLQFTQGITQVNSSSAQRQLASNAPALLNEIESRVNALNVNFSSDPTYRSYVNALVQSSHAIVDKTRADILPQLTGTKNGSALLDLYAGEILPEVKTSLESSDTLIAMQTEMCLEASAPAASPKTIYVISILAGITVVLAVLVALYIANYISYQVSTATKLVSRMAEGDFNFNVEVNSTDEFGQYRENLNKMRNSIGHILALTQKECGKLQTAMNKLHSSAAAVVEAVSNVQNQAITVAAASDEMVSTTADIARNCESAAAGSNMCKDITGNALTQVNRAVDNIRQQAEHTKDNATKIESLARQTHDIGSIVSTIDDIAAQTNLLALNAAIEAARAGEAGRGFAVVADEVRALASRTTKSTQEISKMVKNIQDEARVATESINASVTNMDTVAEDAHGVMQVLDDITNHVTEVNNQITQIATATEEQTTATSEISSNAQSVNTASAEVTQNANEQQQSIKQTLGDLDNLNKALSFFKLRDVDYSGIN